MLPIVTKKGCQTLLTYKERPHILKGKPQDIMWWQGLHLH